MAYLALPMTPEYRVNLNTYRRTNRQAEADANMQPRRSKADWLVTRHAELREDIIALTQEWVDICRQLQAPITTSPFFEAMRLGHLADMNFPRPTKPSPRDKSRDRHLIQKERK